MKRILPILLVLIALVALLVSCGPKEDEPTTTIEEVSTIQQQETSETPNVTTTRGKLGMGISEADEGWSFWGDY